MDDVVANLLAEQRSIIADIKLTIARSRRQSRHLDIEDKNPYRRSTLLLIVEGLIHAHKAALVDADGLTLDLIEDALRHAGMRLAKETSDGRAFDRKRLQSL